MSKDKEKVSRLQVIDPVLLTNILQRLDENAKRQSTSNDLDQSGLNKIINDYDRYLNLPSDSGLKDTFRMNLLSRVANIKSRAQNREASLSNVHCCSGRGDGSSGESGDRLNKSEDYLKGSLGRKSVRDFKNALEANGFREGADGFMVSGDGKSTGVKYKDVLNHFGRNISSLKSYHLNDWDKVRVVNLLKKSGFNRSGIKNAGSRVAFDVQDISQDAFRSQIMRTTPLKSRKPAKMSDGEGSSVAITNFDSFLSGDSSDGLYATQKLKKYK